MPFLLKAVAAALKEFPQYNSSLSPDGESLLLKKYVNIGVAVDTPNGLMVPVVRDVDQKGVFELAADLMTLSGKARPASCPRATCRAAASPSPAWVASAVPSSPPSSTHRRWPSWVCHVQT